VSYYKHFDNRQIFVKCIKIILFLAKQETRIITQFSFFQSLVKLSTATSTLGRVGQPPVDW